jgi:hypothetical protein
MTDNKSKKRADGRRVALAQEHERDYLLLIVGDIEARLSAAAVELHRLRMRLRAGFPKKNKRGRK